MTYSAQRLLAAIFAIAATFNACSDLGEPLPVSQSETVSFAASVLPVLTANCGGGNCHLSGKSQVGLSLETYASLMAGSDNGPVVIAGDGAGSLIIRKLRGTAGTRMPQGNLALPGSTISTIEIWIDQGALDN